jgi:general L-amino acid transport system permease protein
MLSRRQPARSWPRGAPEAPPAGPAAPVSAPPAFLFAVAVNLLAAGLALGAGVWDWHSADAPGEGWTAGVGVARNLVWLLVSAALLGRREWAKAAYARLLPLALLADLLLTDRIGASFLSAAAIGAITLYFANRAAASAWLESRRQEDAVGRAWNNPAVRGLVDQLLLVAVVGLVGWYLVHNVSVNLAQQNIASGFGFLSREAGFAIGESLLPYDPSETYRRALLVGLLNTLKVAALGIVLATLIGLVVGIARLSSNWLVAKLAAVYVEGVRNIPVLLQLFIWYAVITVSLPHPRRAAEPVPGVFLSNRGLMFPVPEAHPVQSYVLIALLVGLAAAWAMGKWAKRRQMATGRQFPTLWAGLGLILGLPTLVWLAGGAPVALDVPELRGFNFRGGVEVSPEFAAVLFGLSFYTAGFIAEIVRSGILAVPHGQSEAAGALGLHRGLVLRLVVLPQALRLIIPPTTSQYLNLTKNSSLAVAVGYPDLVSIGNTTMNQTGQAIEAISIYMMVYLTISLLISLFMNLYNRRIALVER